MYISIILYTYRQSIWVAFFSGLCPLLHASQLGIPEESGYSDSMKLKSDMIIKSFNSHIYKKCERDFILFQITLTNLNSDYFNKPTVLYKKSTTRCQGVWNSMSTQEFCTSA